MKLDPTRHLRGTNFASKKIEISKFSHFHWLFRRFFPEIVWSQKNIFFEIWNFENQFSSWKINIFCSDFFCEQGMVMYCTKMASTGDIEQFTPPLQFQRDSKNVEIASWGSRNWLTISTIYNFNGRAKRASGKHGDNFNGFAISTFINLQEWHNFNGIQFQHAREARQRKNSIQFQRCNNFYFFGNDISLQFLRAQNFYFSYFTNWLQFQRNTISTGARSAPTKNNLQFQRCNNFYVLGDDISLQFLRAKNFYFLYFQIDDNFNEVQNFNFRSTWHTLTIAERKGLLRNAKG